MTDAPSPVAPVVVGLDGSAAAAKALQWAAREAAGRGVPLRVVSVSDPYGRLEEPLSEAEFVAVLRGAQAQTGQPPREDAEANALLVDARAVALRLGAPDVQVEGRVGGVVESLLDAAAGARMLVIGMTGVGERAGVAVGSTAKALASHAECPVVIVPLGYVLDAALPVAGPVVVGVDGSPTSDGALAAGFAAAAWRRAPLVAVHAWRDIAVPATLTAEAGAPGDAAAGVARAAEDGALRERLARWRDRYPAVQVTALVEMDRPVRALARLGADAQLVVVGSRGRGGFTGMLLGSTSSALMHTLDTPLMIVRAPRGGANPERMVERCAPLS